MLKKNLIGLVLFCVASLSQGAESDLGASERLISILSTNDIHGGVEATPNKDGKLVGGMALWGGVAKALREGIEKRYPGKSGVVIVDAGDQFQGTLLSNYDEGELVFATMSEVGYDAAVPGNHDYDFGPSGWLVDQSADEAKRREALLKILKVARFPLISANTFYSDSLVDTAGKKAKVDNRHCRPLEAGTTLDWKRAQRPEFVTPYVLKTISGVRVALIGIDNSLTPDVTTIDNVKDLCFGDEAEHYRRTRAELEGKADVFVLVIHNGDAKSDQDLTPLVKSLTSPTVLVDAVVSGHTHFTYNERINGVPVVQSGFGGTSFGRIDLVWDLNTRSLVGKKTKSAAGIRLMEKECDAYAKKFSETFCEVTESGVVYEKVPAVPSPAVERLVAKARKNIAHLANRHLGHTHKELTRDRIKENPLADVMTDVLRELGKADVSAINTGGLRDTLRAGDFTYEDLFRVLPFGNRGVIVGPMKTKTLIGLLEKSVQTCGSYGALMQSGLQVTFRRDCSHSVETGGVDKDARLIRVETLAGKLLYDATAGGIVATAPAEVDRVATLDFLATGGSGFAGFKEAPVKEDLGILREVMTEKFIKSPAKWNGEIDGRWKNILPE